MWIFIDSVTFLSALFHAISWYPILFKLGPFIHQNFITLPYYLNTCKNVLSLNVKQDSYNSLLLLFKHPGYGYIHYEPDDIGADLDIELVS